MPAQHPALGIDLGEARIGIAATDPLGILAHPVETIHLSQTDPLPRLAQLIADRQIMQLVLGLPLRLDGSEGTAAEKVRAFAAKLEEHFPSLPLHLVDERLTTKTATEKLRSAGKKTKSHRAIIDQAAAVEILITWMDESQL